MIWEERRKVGLTFFGPKSRLDFMIGAVWVQHVGGDCYNLELYP